MTAPALAGKYNVQAHFSGDALYALKDSTTRTLTVK